jgi:glutamate-ammonia-ligase adenylyltransferase
MLAHDVVLMRKRLESGGLRADADIKRGRGGEADVEFAVQLTQLCHGSQHPSILEPNTWEAIDAIESAGLWSTERARLFRDGYTLLRLVESRLRIVYNLARNDIPTRADERDKLAQRTGYAHGQQLVDELTRRMDLLREEFLATAADL